MSNSSFGYNVFSSCVKELDSTCNFNALEFITSEATHYIWLKGLGNFVVHN